ncbi:MAG: response regulator [Chloroflexia bacterium]|nr:response regulator [Chloroflexia bacterium]
MSTPVILLVEKDSRLAQAMTAALERRVLPRPVHVTSGEAAVLWVAANACDVCLLDYDLPGANGLETLARIRQRKPDLPVIMLSSVESEQIAVAAFRAGVVDYVSKKQGFQDVAAGLVQQIVTSTTGTVVSSPATVADGVPAELTQPTYQNRLRVIGRQLDTYRYQAMNLMEVGGGMLVRGTPRGSRTPEALEFLDKDFPQLFRSGLAARGENEWVRAKTPLLPTGYEDFLRALGHRLDSQYAEAVSVTELDSFFAVGGVAKVEASGHTAMAPLQWLLYADDITYLLDEAYRRRAQVAAKKPSGIGRILGRQERSG